MKVAKVKVSENYYQAAFTGGGLSYATQLVKNQATAIIYNYRDTIPDAKADFSGLECRWKNIPSKHGETVSLIVKAVSASHEVNNQIYQELIEKILAIYGSEDYLNPIAKEHLKLAFNYKYLRSETKLRAKSSRFLDKLIYFLKIVIENLLGWFLMDFKIKFPDIDWGAYKENTIATTDYKKFDDMLRMVIAGNKIQRKRLTRYLENNYRKNKLVYGLHVSDRALMTCLVFERNGNQVHFIDGADGGYAAAAKVMKQRSKHIKSKRTAERVTLECQPLTDLVSSKCDR